MITFARIDDKLVHGQVATTWARVSGANRIYIVDDSTAKDPFLTNLFKQLAPQGTKVEVWDVKTGCEKIKLLEQHDKIKGFVLCKGPYEFLALAKAGGHFKEIIVGNMASRNDRVQLIPTANTYASKEEIQMFKELEELGNKVYLHMIPDKPKVPILDAPGVKQLL